MLKDQKDLEAYLARIRKTVADSKNVVSQAQLRMAETDRMLEKQGLTREQVMSMHFTEAQLEAVDAELKRRGLDPLERWDELERARAGDAQTLAPARAVDLEPASGIDDEVAYRQKKFGMMMKPFQI